MREGYYVKSGCSQYPLRVRKEGDGKLLIEECRGAYWYVVDSLGTDEVLANDWELVPNASITN